MKEVRSIFLFSNTGLVERVNRIVTSRSVVNGVIRDVDYAVVADDKGTQIYNLDHYRLMTENPDGGDAA